MTFFKAFPKTNIQLFNDNEIYNIRNTFRYAKIPKKFLNNYLAYTKYTIKDGERPDIVSTKLYGSPDYYWTFFLVNDFLKNTYSNWMMSTYKLQEYVKIHMMDTIINMRPTYVLDDDNLLLRVENSVVNTFDIENKEPVTGFLSGATGNVIDYDTSLQQIRITNVDGLFRPNEIIIGNNTDDRIISYEVFKMYEAPCEYRDSTGSVVDNELFFEDGITNTNLTPISYYQKIQEDNEKKSTINIINPGYIDEFVKQYKAIIGT